MRTMIIALTLLALVLTGCSASDPAKTETATANQAVSVNPTTGSPFAINEISLGSKAMLP